MAYPKTYKTDKGVYEIPEKEVSSFLKDFPNAMEVVSYKMGKDTFDIPVQETEVFLKENPQAVPLKKKEPSGNGLQEPSDGGLGGTTSTTEPIPTIEMYQTPTGDLTEDPFNQVKKAKELLGKTKVVSKGGIGGMGMGTTGTEIVPDEEATKEANKIQEELKRTGYKEDFFAGISDLPEDVYNNPTTSKETLSVLYKNNPVKFTQLTNEAKNKYAIRDAAAKKAYDEAQGDDKQKTEYASRVGILKGNEYSGDEIAPPENMQQFYDIVKQKQQLINQNIDSPEEKKKAQERLRQTYAQAINPTSLDFREEYENSGLADKLDVTQYAGLKTYELFEPEKAKVLRSMVEANITPQWNVNVQVTPEEQVRSIVTDSAMAEKMGGTLSQLTVNKRIGKEEALRELSLLGATNEYDSIVSEQNDLKKRYQEAKTDEEKANIYAKMLLNEQRANDLQKTEAKNDERYPITAKLKMDNLVKEIVQDRGIGVGGWMYNKYAHGVGSGVDAVENLVTSIFGSEKEKTDLRMKRIGEGKQFEASIYLPESERSVNSPVIIQASDELKKKAKEILNGRSLSELSPDEKDKLSQLVASNQDQIKTITNPEAGKSKNFWSKATGMTIAGFTADMGSFLTKMGLMQGVGMGAKAAEATTLFMDGYEPAFNKKLAEGASVESANEYGILHGAVLSLMSKFGSKYETIKNVVKGGNSPISKYIAGLSEESWNKLAGEAKPLLSRLGKASKDIVKEQGKMIGTFGVAAPVTSAVADNLFYDEGRSVREIADEALLSAKEMAIGGIGFGLFGLAKGVMKTKATPVEKAALFEMADYQGLGKMRIDEAVKNREISKEEGERKKGIIDNVSRLVEQVPEVNDKGKPLNDQQRANYLFNLAVKESQKEKAKTLPEKQAEEAKQKALVADKQNQIELEALTEKQLNDRKDKLGKAISKVDEKGKPELSDKEMADAKAELEAVENIIKSKGDTTKQKEELPDLTEPLEGRDKKGIPIGEDVPSETKQQPSPVSEQSIDYSEVKVPAYREALKKATPEEKDQILKDISDQWHDEGKREATERNFGKQLVDEAVKKFPQEKQASLSIEEKPIEPEVESIAETKPTETTLPAEEGKGAEPPKPPKETVEESASENDVSGIKKALVSEEIIKGVDLDKVSDKEMMNLGRKILDTGEVKPESLVSKIVSEGRGVLTPAEVVGLITYKRDIDNKLRETYSEINKKKEAGEELGTLEVEAKALEKQQHDFDVMSVITAQQQSMAFRLRQQMLDRDYNPVTQIEKYKANNNGYIPPEIEAKFNELGKRLDEVKQKISEEKAKQDIKEAEKTVQNIKEDVDRELKRKGVELTDEQLDKKVQEGVDKEIEKLYQELPSEKKSAADKAISALEKFRKNIKSKTYESTLGIPVAIADLGAATAIRAIKVGKTVAEAVELGIKRIKEALKKKGIDEWDESVFKKDITDFLESEGVGTKKSKDKPTIKEDGSIYIPNEMLRKLVKNGKTDINELTDAVYEQVVKELPDITKRQVRDYITDYGRKVNPTADEIQTQLNTAKRVGRLLSDVEDLQNKKAKTKNPEKRAKITEKERELKRQIRSLEKDAGITHKSELTDSEKLAAAKNRVKNRISELERRIKNKDFAKKEKLPEAKDEELLRLEAEKEKLQEKFDEEQYKLTLKNRNLWQKAEDVAVELSTGVVRGLVASFDLSAGLVQGMYRLFVDLGKSAYQLAKFQKPSPNRSLNAFGTMFKHLVSQKSSEEYLQKVKSSKDYPLMQASKLAIDDKSGHVSAKEGLFISNWVNLTWDKVISPILGVGTKTGTGFIRKINPYSASQRAFDGYVNSIRVNSFLEFAESLKKDGYTFESNPEVYKKAADVINTTTGRGSLGAADASSKWLNIFLFAPRKVISEVKLFTPYSFAYYAKLPAPVRKKALIDLATFVTTFTTANALVWAANKKDGDEDDNFWNPNSSDFLTHKIGDKRISIGGGAKSMIVFQSRFLTGTFVDQYGKETKLGDRYGKQINTRLDLTWRFILGKASPAISVASKKMDERKGVEIDDAEMIRDLTVPIWMQDLKSLYQESPATVSALLTAFSIFGANVRTVNANKNSPFTAEDKKDPVFKYWLDMGMELPNVVPASVDVPDKVTKTIKNLTEYPKEKIEEYQKEHKKFLKEKLKHYEDKGYVYVDEYGGVSTNYKNPPKGSKKKNIKDLDKIQKAKILKVAQSDATDKTKEKLFPK